MKRSNVLAVANSSRADVTEDGVPVTVNLLKPEQTFFTLAEAASFVRLSPSLLYKLTSAGKIKPARIGSKLVFSREALVDFMAGAIKRPVVLNGKDGAA